MSRKYDETVMTVALKAAAEVAEKLMEEKDLTDDQRKVLDDAVSLNGKYLSAFTNAVG